MKNKKQVNGSKILKYLMVSAMIVGPLQSGSIVNVNALDNNTILINEIESNDNTGGNDWIEIINTGNSAVDLSGWFLSDDKGLERLDDGSTKRLDDGTIIQPNEIIVFMLEDDNTISFGLGKDDTAAIYDKNNNLIDSYTYEGHAVGTYSRVVGQANFVDQDPTKGLANIISEESKSEGKLVINEINSSPDDWVEFMNIGETALDISGYEIRDNSNDHRWQFLEGTIIEPGEILLVDANTSGKVYDDEQNIYVDGTFESAIGIGSGDSIRLYDDAGSQIDSHSWSEHASFDGDAAKASLGRYPDGIGSFHLMKETPNAKNDWYKPSVVINEIAQDVSDVDWVEIYNIGSEDVDISGWTIMDNDPVGHADEVTPIKEGTILKSKEFYVLELNKDFTFGLGKEDQVTLYNQDGAEIDQYAWSQHADNNGVYARIPDGTGEFKMFTTPTKGKMNIVTSPVVINEIQTNDPNGKADWIELANPTNKVIDISGLVLKDNDDSHSYTIPEGTKINANGFLVLSQDDFGFGLGSEDAIRLYENQLEIGNVSWTTHSHPTLGLYPDVNGNEYKMTLEQTPGFINKFAGIPDVVEWDGRQDTHVFDQTATFLEDSSGLDFHNGKLYAVDNGTASFWILNVAKDGTMNILDQKYVSFKKDVGNSQAASPDSEGITVDGEGYVYLASERDNADKGVNFNTILKVNPNTTETNITTIQEWDLTASLPQVSANMGIEAVEWVANEEIEGKIIDQNTGKVFDSKNYPLATAKGVFFVALEDNGHTYAYVLNSDGTVVQIADIDSKIGGAMALDYDTHNDVLWVAADNGYNNISAKIVFNGTNEPNIIHVKAPTSVDTTLNYEGFAIATVDYTIDGQRPFYKFQDGVTSQALLIGSMSEKSNSSEEDTIPPITDPEENNRPGQDDNNNNDISNNTSNNDTTNKDGVNEGNFNSPNTSDSSNLMLYTITLIVSLVALISKNRKLFLKD